MPEPPQPPPPRGASCTIQPLPSGSLKARKEPYGAAIRVDARRLALRPEVEGLADLDAATGEQRVRGLDVLDHEVHAAVGARLRGGDSGAEGDRGRRARRGDLDDAEALPRAVVDVDVPAERLAVERLGAVDVGDRQDRELVAERHRRRLGRGAAAPARERRRAPLALDPVVDVLDDLAVVVEAQHRGAGERDGLERLLPARPPLDGGAAVGGDRRAESALDVRLGGELAAQVALGAALPRGRAAGATGTSRRRHRGRRCPRCAWPARRAPTCAPSARPPSGCPSRRPYRARSSRRSGMAGAEGAVR